MIIFYKLLGMERKIAERKIAENDLHSSNENHVCTKFCLNYLQNLPENFVSSKNYFACMVIGKLCDAN